MKETLKKIANVCKLIFGYGIMIVLFLGGLTFFGYVAALIIGGDTATAICTWIYKTFFPIIIMASTILILFGLLTMYLAGEKALTPEHKKARENAEKARESELEKAADEEENAADETEDAAAPGTEEAAASETEDAEGKEKE